MPSSMPLRRCLCPGADPGPHPLTRPDKMALPVVLDDVGGGDGAVFLEDELSFSKTIVLPAQPVLGRTSL